MYLGHVITVVNGPWPEVYLGHVITVSMTGGWWRLGSMYAFTGFILQFYYGLRCVKVCDYELSAGSKLNFGLGLKEHLKKF